MLLLHNEYRRSKRCHVCLVPDNNCNFLDFSNEVITVLV